jgi:drug/metabolite transporter (DMT)-like permease
VSLVVVGLGLLSALAYGAGDFLGGLASRRAEASLGVVALFNVVALALFAAAVPLAGAGPAAGAVAWGGAAGIAMGLAYVCYFQALADGRMGVVATLTAVWSAVVPLAAGVALGERPSPLAWAGIVAIVLAIALITYTPDRPQPAWHSAPVYGGDGDGARAVTRSSRATRDRRPGPVLAAGVAQATGAGIGFGGFFVGLDRASTFDGAVAWPLLAAATSAAVVVGAVAAGRRVDWRCAREQAPAIVAAGALHAAGSWAFIAGTSLGWVSVVAVIAALSPVPTMLLARWVLSESLTGIQRVGVPLALLGVALVSAGMPR